MAAKSLPSPEALRQLLRYDPESGRFWWLARPGDRTGWNARYAGAEAFTSTAKNGYRVTNLGGYVLTAHRVAWAMTHGKWPKMVDHINGNRTDNRLCNLREATGHQNGHNRRGNLAGSSRYKGVHWASRMQAWVAQIGAHGKHKYLGAHKCETAAALAYDKAAKVAHGEYARLNINEPRAL